MTTATSPSGAATPWSWRAGLTYGAMGWPLAFMALPLYVVLPHHYASTWGAPLAGLGAVLLATRLLDAFTDPWIGRWVDTWFRQSTRAVTTRCAVAAVALGLGFAALFEPPAQIWGLAGWRLLAWLAAALVWTCFAYSVLSVAHQAWGARLGGDAVHRGRVVAWREAFGLGGVVVSAALPVVAGVGALVGVLWLALLVGWLLWRGAPAPNGPVVPVAVLEGFNPWHHPPFRRLMAVFVLNGVASALPATLLLFFLQDRLQAPRSVEPLVLGVYFATGALSLPLWLRAVARWGLAHTWLGGMALAVLVFVWTAGLQAGDWPVFVAVSGLAGLALGADLALPGALLAGVVADAGQRGRAEGAFVGWWAWATKLNLALAAGLALPVLAVLGYEPGARDPGALHALTWAYSLLPCALKGLAAGALYVLLIRRGVA